MPLQLPSMAEISRLWLAAVIAAAHLVALVLLARATSCGTVGHLVLGLG